MVVFNFFWAFSLGIIPHLDDDIFVSDSQLYMYYFFFLPYSAGYDL